MHRRLVRALPQVASLLALVACGRVGIEYVGQPGDDGVPEGPLSGVIADSDAATLAMPPVDTGTSDGAASVSDALSGARRDGGAQDAASPPPASELDAATPDAAPTDTDAALVTDGAVDAGDDSVPDVLATEITCSSFGGAIACSDFNGSAVGTTVDNVGAVAMDGYLRATADANTPRAAAHVSFEGVAQGALYLRFSLYVPASTSIVGLSIARLGAFDAVTDFGVDLDLVRDGELELVTSAGTTASATRVARGRWQCILLEVDSIDSGTGAARVTLDGSVVLTRSNIDSEPPGGIAAAAAGIEATAPGQGSATVLVDNVLLTSQPPGLCP